MENLDTVDQAFNKAVKYLSFRARSGKEIKTYLNEKGYGFEVTEAVMNKLADYNYINDTEFARIFVNSYAAKCGKREIKMRLRQAGISDSIIENALNYDETESTLAAVKKYLRMHDFNREKLYNYLFNKGFLSDSITAAIKQIENEEFENNND